MDLILTTSSEKVRSTKRFSELGTVEAREHGKKIELYWVSGATNLAD